ncbi:serine hydrolase domain-containing protein [Maricaulis sp.]|uniref:serine hydrolase domain-containing protein n=1 Tax=Maricaulis sp. TaxID=1486257 RepID=UPI0025BE7CF4|nr:serine hydrolase domain-containing protein [Maricaulis sp.]
MIRPSFAGLANPFVMLAFSLAVLPGPSAAAQTEPADFVEALRPRVVTGVADETWSLEARMAHYGVPGVAIAIIADGDIVLATGYGVLQAGGSNPVTADTVFSAGSVSKVATASLILHLVAQGELDLDRDVRAQLTRWQLPAERDMSPEAPVTLRALLSHTAGFNLHGFADFQPGEALPTTVQTLDGKAPATHAPLAREHAPATRYRYSGGGYTMVQLLVSDVLERPFQEAAAAHLFAPLGLDRSSFANPLPQAHGNIARAHDRLGAPAALPRGYEAMPEAAASGLWTSAHDLGRLVTMLMADYHGQGRYLPQPLAIEMLTRVAPGEHGLGPRVTGLAQDFFFHHGGANNSYQTWIEGHPQSGEGLVILTNGARGRALINEIRNAVSDTMNWTINAPVIDPGLDLPEGLLADYAGTYTLDQSFPLALRQQMVGRFFQNDLEIRATDGALSVGAAGTEQFFELVPLSPTCFLIPAIEETVGLARIDLHRDARGRTTGMSFSLENAISHYQRQ